MDLTPAQVVESYQFYTATRNPNRFIGCQAFVGDRMCKNSTMPLCGTHLRLYARGKGIYTQEFKETVELVRQQLERERVERERLERERVDQAEAVRLREVEETRLTLERAHREAQRETEALLREVESRRRLREDRQRLREERRRIGEEQHRLEENMHRLGEIQLRLEEDKESVAFFTATFLDDSSRRMIPSKNPVECEVCCEGVSTHFFPCCQTVEGKLQICLECINKMRKREFLKCPKCRKMCFYQE